MTNTYYKVIANIINMCRWSKLRVSRPKCCTSACSYGVLFQHSPSSLAQAKFCRKMLDLRGGQCLSKAISNHVGSQTKNELKNSFFDNPADEMETDVDVFSTCMVLMVLRK